MVKTFQLLLTVILVTFRYAHIFFLELGYKYLWREKEHILDVFHSFSMCNGNLVHGTQSRAFICTHTWTMSGLQTIRTRQQLRLPPSILSKIYYGVKFDSKFWFSTNLANVCNITSKGTFKYFVMCISFYISLLIGHLLIVCPLKLFKHSLLLWLAQANLFLFHQHLFFPETEKINSRKG